MPTQSRGFFACDHCGLKLDTLEEAIEHEQTCPSRRTLGHLPAHPQQQQQGPPQQTANYFLQQQQYRHGLIGMGPLAPGALEGTEGYTNPYARAAPYARYDRGMPPMTGDASAEGHYPPKSGTRGAEMRCFPLVNYPPDRSTDILTMIDTTACQNIEVFETTPEIIAGYERISGNNRIAPKQVGLRCRNCGSGSNNNSGIPSISEAGAQLFPDDLFSIGSCARQIADHHLTTCRQTNSDVQEACRRAASKRQQRERGMVGLTEGATSDGGDDQASKAALVDYCVGICQQMGIGNKSNNKSGIEFAGVGGSHRDTAVAQTPLQRRRGTTSTTASTTDYPGSQSGQPAYAETPGNFPFYQETDRTWHCWYCKHIPHQYRDSQSIWSSPGGGPPPSSFVDQHLSVCRAYRQQVSSMPPGGGMLSRQPPFGMNPYGAPSPSPYGIQMHGQPPNPPTPWDTSMPLGGVMQSSHTQYPSLMDPNYRYGQPFPHSVGNPHAMDTGMGGARFLSTLGQSGYPDRGGPIMPAMTSSGVRNPPYSLAGGSVTPDLMKEAMSFLANYDVEYYARDPESAKIPKLVLDEDHLLLTDYFFYLMKQLRLVRFTENDRKTRGGKREKIKIGYGGLQCIHCADLPMSRKFFWSNVDRLANSFAEIPGHVLKCRRCPQANKDALLRLKKGHPEQMSKLPRGSQKIFFRRMWRRLHEGDPPDDNVVVESPMAASASYNTRPPVSSIKTSPEKDTKSLEDVSHSGSITVTSDETILVMQRSAKEAAKALAQSAVNKSGPPSPSSRILVAIPEDKEWLSDIDSYVRRQLEVFCATEEDVAAAREDRKYPITVGQVGIRCIHCAIAQGNDAIGHAIAYPFSISGIYESVKEFHRLHLDSCPNLPNTSKARLESMKGASSLSSVLRKYYTLSAKALGLVDTKDGIRTGGVSTPIGSLAAFTFSETDDGSPAKSRDESDGSPRIRGKKRAEPPSTTDGSESNKKYAKRQP